MDDDAGTGRRTDLAASPGGDDPMMETVTTRLIEGSTLGADQQPGGAA